MPLRNRDKHQNIFLINMRKINIIYNFINIIFINYI